MQGFLSLLISLLLVFIQQMRINKFKSEKDWLLVLACCIPLHESQFIAAAASPCNPQPNLV